MGATQLHPSPSLLLSPGTESHSFSLLHLSSMLIEDSCLLCLPLVPPYRLCFQDTTYHWREVRAGTCTEPMEECYLPAYSAGFLTQHRHRPTCLRMVLHTGPCLPPSVISKESLTDGHWPTWSGPSLYWDSSDDCSLCHIDSWSYLGCHAWSQEKGGQRSSEGKGIPPTNT